MPKDIPGKLLWRGWIWRMLTGSVRHMFIQFALKWFHIPQQICELFFRYYDEIFLAVVTEDWRSDWFQLAIGVPQGCAASTTIFDVAFQVLILLLLTTEET